jgi:hypothetical protein
MFPPAGPGPEEAPGAWRVFEDLSCNWQAIHGHRAVWELSEHSANSALQNPAW